MLEQTANTEIDLGGWCAEQRSKVFLKQAPNSYDERMFHSLLPSLSPNRKRKYHEEEGDQEIEKWFNNGNAEAPVNIVDISGFKTPDAGIRSEEGESPATGDSPVTADSAVTGGIIDSPAVVAGAAEEGEASLGGGANDSQL